MENDKNNEVKKEETFNKNFLNLLKENIFSISIILGAFVCLYHLKDNVEVWFQMIPLSIILLFLFVDNILVELIMTAGLGFLLYEISKQKLDFLTFIIITLYFFINFCQKILEDSINKILEKFYRFIYFIINFSLLMTRFFLIYNLIKSLPESEGCINLEIFINGAVFFTEAIFNTFYEKEKIKRSNIENKPLLPLKVYSLLFFMMYEIFIFFIYPNNWILFVCFNLFVFIILFHKIEEDKEANK
ncbi:hypothetical protein [Fusobacterium nucleatum]|uniref:hypothetical protein n=1 Tax=Fusobacterium nucleatum TaxID=851 RepID=UPI0030CA6643